jgi:hypothetical protein
LCEVDANPIGCDALDRLDVTQRRMLVEVPRIPSRLVEEVCHEVGVQTCTVGELQQQLILTTRSRVSNRETLWNA